MTCKTATLLYLSSITCALVSSASAQTPQQYDHAAVVSAHPEATKVGVDILKNGGNAVDAAIAVQFALAVAYPNAGNIGGGGFLVYRSKKGITDALDYREQAPKKRLKICIWIRWVIL